MSAAPTTLAKKAPAATLSEFLNSPGARARLDEVASRYLRPEELIRLALMAASRNPDILKCATHSILRALMDAASVGIAPSGMMGRGYLVPRKNNKTGEMEASFDPGWRGLADIAKRSGTVKRIDAKVVFEGDIFSYEEGTEQKLRHVPNLDLPEDDAEAEEQQNRRIVCAYAIATFDNGEKQIEVLRKSDIERIRKVSAASGGPWATWYDEMARKSAVRRLCKYLPYDAVLERALDMATDVETGARTTVDMAPKRVAASTADLEQRLLAEKPATVPADVAREAAPVAARTLGAPASVPPPAAKSAPVPATDTAERCIWCKEVLGIDAVEFEGPDGELWSRHPQCTKFGRGTV